MADLQEAHPYIDADDIPSMVVPLILNKLRDYLEVELQDEVAEDDPTKAVLVKVGRFQDNPVRKNVSVAISGGDYEDPAYMDGRIDHESMDEFKIRNLPVGEVGGGIYWWRRGTMNFQAFFVKQRYEEEIAMKYAYEFYGRLLRAVETCRLGNLVDYFGEQATGTPYIEGASFFESGGANQYIWRGKLKWRVLTWRE